MADRLSGRKTGLQRALNSSLDSRGTRQNWIGATELELSLTSQTKQLQHHLPPRASTAWSLSRMDFLHRLHFGSRRRTWQGSQYGWPRKTVNPSKSPSPLNASSPEKPIIGIIRSSYHNNSRKYVPLESAEIEGDKNGSPHSAQKKCWVWYVRLPNAGSSRLMNCSSMIAVLHE